jgi:osmoprotectant transport system permease protein
MSGIRSATLQVIATATVAAYAPFLGGLGRLILDGVDVINDPHSGYPAMVSAGLLVAVLAVVADLVLIGLERVVVSPGVSGRAARRRARPTAIPAGGAVVDLAKA